MAESKQKYISENTPSNKGNHSSVILGGCIAVAAGVLLGLLVVGIPSPVMVLTAGLGLFATCVIIARIDWGLFLFVLITYSYFSSVAIENFGIPSLAKIFVVLLLFGIMLRWVIWDERPSGWGRVTLLIGIYCLVGAASMVYSADITQTRTTLFYLVKDSIIAIIVVILLKQANVLRGVIWSLLAAGIFMGTFGVYQHLTGTFDNSYWGLATSEMRDIVDGTTHYRIGGPIGSSNFFAQILLALIPLAFERMWHEKSFVFKSLAAWTLIVCTLSLFFTYSRGGFLALIVMLLVFIGLYPPRTKLVLMLLITGIPLLYFVPPQYVDRMITLRQ
jgi:O-antigen ligase